MYDINKIREDFPILSREVYKKPLVYLDNAATTQKPLMVLDAMRDEYLNVNANVHRGVHYLSQQATDLHEAAREKVRQFINAKKIEEIVFTRGTTEAINLVVSSFCESQMEAGDEVIVTEMEHHSNIVSWQLQAMKRGIIVKHIPITDDGILCLFPKQFKFVLGKLNIIVLRQLDVEFILFLVADAQAVAAQVAAACDGGTKAMLVVVVWIEDVYLGVNLL